MLEIFTIVFFITLFYAFAALVAVAPTASQSLATPTAIGEKTRKLWRQGVEDRRLAMALAAHVPQGFEQRSLAELAFEIGHMVDDESAYQALAPIQLLRMVGNLAIVWDRYRGKKMSVALCKDQCWKHAVYQIFQDGIGWQFWQEFRNRELKFYSI